MRVWMQICWCTIKVQPNTLVNFKHFKKNIFIFLGFTLQQISTKDYDIVKFAHTFCFNDQCQSVSGQQLIFLKIKTKIKSKSIRKRVCKAIRFGFVKKWQNPSDSKSVASLESISPWCLSVFNRDTVPVNSNKTMISPELQCLMDYLLTTFVWNFVWICAVVHRDGNDMNFGIPWLLHCQLYWLPMV